MKTRNFLSIGVLLLAGLSTSCTVSDLARSSKTRKTPEPVEPQEFSERIEDFAVGRGGFCYDCERQEIARLEAEIARAQAKIQKLEGGG